MLEKLRELKLVTPLQQSQSCAPMITCAPNGQHPTAFEAPLDTWTVDTSSTASSYWLFHESGPIYLWVASETDPPLWKNAPLSRLLDGIDYWRDLQSACTKLEAAVNVQDTGTLETQSTNIGMARSFRRGVSWRSEYFLTWHQTQYLKQFTEASGMSPLDIPDPNEREAKLSKICWVTSAPREAVEKFYEHNKEKLAKVFEKLEEKVKRTGKGILSLTKKSEEARSQREHVWSDLLSRCHPNEIPPPAALRIERIHKQFLQAGSIKDTDRWEKEIQAALRETDLASIKALKTPSRPSLPRPAAASAVTAQPSPHKDVLTIEDLVEMQGPPLDQGSQNRKRKRKNRRDDGTYVDHYRAGKVPHPCQQQQQRCRRRSYEDTVSSGIPSLMN
jgi:transcription factor C subunit 3